MRYRIITAVITVTILLASGDLSLQAGWTLDGAPVCTYVGTQDSPRILSDGSGGAFVVWNDTRTWTDIYAQRLDYMGRPQWAENGIVVSHGSGYQDMVEIAPDGEGGFIAVWQDGREETHQDVYAQKVAPDGSMLWTTDGVPVCTEPNDQLQPKICSDGTGGCIITWVDKRNDSGSSDIFAQRLSPADGSAMWTAGGVGVCTADSTQVEPRIVMDGAGGAIIVWIDNRTERDIYAQRLGPGGSAQWAAGGAPVCDLQGSEQYSHDIDIDGQGGAFVTWCDRQGSGLDIRVQRIDASGSIVFAPEGLTLCSAYSTQRAPVIAFDGYRGAIVAWEDYRSGPEDSDVYVQRVSDKGAILYDEPDGILVCNSANNVYSVKVFCNTVGEAVVAWEDLRDSGVSGHDVYAQRLDGDGVCAWTSNGEPLCTAASTQENIVLTGDGDRGMIAAWADYRDHDWNVYAMKITYDGGFVSTELASFDCSSTPDGITVEWRVSKLGVPADFAVSRRSAGSDEYADLSAPTKTVDGLSFSVIDRTAKPGVEYAYRVDILVDGTRRSLFETETISIAPASLRLMQNSPNPFNPSTRIGWALDRECRVRLEIFDPAGRSVAVLADRVMEPGRHETVWNGTGSDGEPVASGVYMYRLAAGRRTLTRKMVLLR